ncbi:MAG: PAS domain S-box protein [Chloroflexi bacterium]|nr:PAS domain S-box protein [Chloroflexota bacterium]MDA1174193.1 PAS domain S-box protein [Chloroflexota bacterium]
MDHRLRILVIDDDEDDFVVTRDILRDVWEDDVDVHWVSTYQDGLAAVREGKHDACLLDYHLGAKTGVDLMMEMGDGTARMPIILMTGSDEASVDLAAMKAGAADYLVKGQSSAGLVERSVRYAIARVQAEKQRRLASVVEFAHDAIIEVGADGAIRSWNAGAFRVFGLTSDQAVGQSITCMGFNDEALLGGLLDQVQWGVKVEKAEALVTREGGDEIWVSTQVSPAAAGDGEGFSVIARDITDSKQAELRRNNFVSIASH